MMKDMFHVNCSECGMSYDNGPGTVPPYPVCPECEDYEDAIAGRIQLPDIHILSIEEITLEEAEEMERQERMNPGIYTDIMSAAELQELENQLRMEI